jgi:hypothetical protein
VMLTDRGNASGATVFFIELAHAGVILIMTSYDCR